MCVLWVVFRRLTQTLLFCVCYRLGGAQRQCEDTRQGHLQDVCFLSFNSFYDPRVILCGPFNMFVVFISYLVGSFHVGHLFTNYLGEFVFLCRYEHLSQNKLD